MNRKWLGVLVLSVGLNLFGAGFLASRCSRGHGPGAGGPFAHPAMGGPLLFQAREALGDDASDEAKTALHTAAQAAREQRKKLRSAHLATQAALEAEPFDSAALAQALRAVRESTASMQDTLHQGLVTVAKSATPEQRRRLSKLNWKHGRHAPHPGE